MRVSKPRTYRAPGRRAESNAARGLVRGRLGAGAVGVGGVDDDVVPASDPTSASAWSMAPQGTASITYAGARDHLGGERGADAIAHVGGAGGELTGGRDKEITTS
ncbi:MAG TPA: hypothetical protein VFC19_27040 [Candidatus Limnocylindrales bacterium]|nr:hypothetical protein [Candidatus Limnocylindrales bacterium]